MKKALIFLLCSVLVFSSLSFSAFAAEHDTADTAADREITDTAAEEEITDTGVKEDLADTGAEEDLAETGWSLVSETTFQSKLSSLRSKYPNGSIWEGVYYEGGSAKAWTCWAYAAQMLYEVFGVRFYADGMMSHKYYDVYGITAGDWVRIDGESHSIFITKVTDSGVYYTDGNGTGVYNQVRWDGYYSWYEMARRFSYRLHLPGNDLTGDVVTHHVVYNSNGGSGTMSSQSVAPNGSFTLQDNGFTRFGYTFAGYTVQRSSDGKWFTSGGNGWQSESNIERYGYNYSIYYPDESYRMSTAWITDLTYSTTLTFYAQWTPSNVVTYNTNGASGSGKTDRVATDDAFTIRQNDFTREGYSFAGYTVKRSTDNKWFTSGGNGWQSQSDIYDNNYTYSIYYPGESYRMSAAWMEDINYDTTLTFYAQWVPDEATIEYAANYSGYNYLLGSNLGSNYSDYIFSRDSSAYSVSVDTFERLNNANSLKITGKKAGSSGSDLAFKTTTNFGYGDGYSQCAPMGDNKEMELRFYAKSSVNGAKMYFRWGYSNDYQSVTLTTDWKVYYVDLPKTAFYGTAIHPFFDCAGTFYLNSLSLGDEWTSNIIPESGTWAAADQVIERGTALTDMPTPTREGYTFLGWYTAAEGGERITEDTVIYESRLRLYAHWVKNTSYEPLKTIRREGHIYELYDNIMGWEDAQRFCSSLGGHLLTIDSRDENRMAYDMIRDRQGYCWLGMYYDESEEAWQWVDGSQITFTEWYDDDYAAADTGEYYAILYPMNYGSFAYAGSWDKCIGSDYHRSYYGYYNSFFICEYDDPFILGDADNNGEIELPDVTLIQYENAGFDTPADIDIMRGDADGNGFLEIADATLISRYLSGMTTPYTINEWIKGY